MQSEIIIIGGGLAGLTASLHLARNGVSVLLFEKDVYPRHKVCGEYLSQEVLPYLEQLEIPLSTLNPKRINRLLFSISTGKAVESSLSPGGFGISRFALDHLLYRQALKNSVQIIQDTVTSVNFNENDFEVATKTNRYTSSFVLGAFGKRSSLDKKLNRPFFQKDSSWLAIKTHYKNGDFPEDLVALHNFKGGYCGLSRTETGSVNFCYLATYKSFRKHKGPENFQELILKNNPHLKHFLENSEPVFDRPLSIAQISFDSKASVKNHILFLGDAAGLIHPLCGNGMAMAIHSAKIASELLLKALRSPEFSRLQLEEEYSAQWNLNFWKRMYTGRTLQRILLNPTLAGFSQKMVSSFPFLLPQIIKQTHGNPVQ